MKIINWILSSITDSFRKGAQDSIIEILGPIVLKIGCIIFIIIAVLLIISIFFVYKFFS